ncbi:MAG: hypothetical protein P8Y63_12270 [Deltaproteobacteria bacterium]|jgi:hypothetical protein
MLMTALLVPIINVQQVKSMHLSYFSSERRAIMDLCDSGRDGEAGCHPAMVARTAGSPMGKHSLTLYLLHFAIGYELESVCYGVSLVLERQWLVII